MGIIVDINDMRYHLQNVDTGHFLKAPVDDRGWLQPEWVEHWEDSHGFAFNAAWEQIHNLWWNGRKVKAIALRTDRLKYHGSPLKK